MAKAIFVLLSRHNGTWVPGQPSLETERFNGHYYRVHGERPPHLIEYAGREFTYATNQISDLNDSETLIYRENVASRRKPSAWAKQRLFLKSIAA